jgi:hypothetical protein
MPVSPKLPLPEDHWKDLWNFSQNLNEAEKALVNQTYEAMRDATDALFDLHAVLGDKEPKLPESVRSLVEEISKTHNEMVATLQNLIKMSADPYEAQRSQLKKGNRLSKGDNK